MQLLNLVFSSFKQFLNLIQKMLNFIKQFQNHARFGVPWFWTKYIFFCIYLIGIPSRVWGSFIDLIVHDFFHDDWVLGCSYEPCRPWKNLYIISSVCLRPESAILPHVADRVVQLKRSSCANSLCASDNTAHVFWQGNAQFWQGSFLPTRSWIWFLKTRRFLPSHHSFSAVRRQGWYLNTCWSQIQKTDPNQILTSHQDFKHCWSQGLLACRRKPGDRKRGSMRGNTLSSAGGGWRDWKRLKESECSCGIQRE